jgi:hypothetical protein
MVLRRMKKAKQPPGSRIKLQLCGPRGTRWSAALQDQWERAKAGLRSRLPQLQAAR